MAIHVNMYVVVDARSNRGKQGTLGQIWKPSKEALLNWVLKSEQRKSGTKNEWHPSKTEQQSGFFFQCSAVSALLPYCKTRFSSPLNSWDFFRGSHRRIYHGVFVGLPKTGRLIRNFTKLFLYYYDLKCVVIMVLRHILENSYRVLSF